MKKISMSQIDSLFKAIAQNEALYIPTDKGDIAEFAKYEDGMTLPKSTTQTARQRISSSRRPRICTTFV